MDLERYATQVMDQELLGKIRIVKTCHHNLPSLIDKIRSKAIGDTDTAGASLLCVTMSSLQCLQCIDNNLMFIFIAFKTQI